jgi:uncharacterized protein (DUF1499 family)
MTSFGADRGGEDGSVTIRSGSAGRWPMRVAMTAAVAFVIGPAAAHFEIVPPFAGFVTCVLGSLVGLLNSVTAIWTFRRGARGRAVAIAALGGIPALLLAHALAGGIGKPAINDITTDLTEPPNLLYAQSQPANNGRDMVYPEAFKEVVRAAYPDLKPLHLAEAPDAAFAQAVRLAEQQPAWQVLYVNGSSRIFEGVATSSLFRFQDDFAVRVRPEGTGSVVDMRSKSRDGTGDLGVNAERIRNFFSQLSGGK